MTTISIEVDNEVAKSFLNATIDEKRQFQMLLNLRLKELIVNPNKPLATIMDEMGSYAESQGMTPELLTALLDEKKVRVVIDTNVAVSAALLPRSVSRQAFDFVVSHAQLLMSEETLSELDEVLCRPKFSKYVSEKQRLTFFAALVRERVYSSY